MWFRFWLLLLSLIGVARYLPIRKQTKKHDKAVVIGMGPHINRSWLKKTFGKCFGSYEIGVSYKDGKWNCRKTLKAKNEAIKSALRCQMMCIYDKSCLYWTYGENTYCCLNTKIVNQIEEDERWVSGARNACPPGMEIRSYNKAGRNIENDANYNKIKDYDTSENELDDANANDVPPDYGHKEFEDTWFTKVAIHPGDNRYRGGCTSLDWDHAPGPFCMKECNTLTKVGIKDRCNKCYCKCTSGPQVPINAQSGRCPNCLPGSYCVRENEKAMKEGKVLKAAATRDYQRIGDYRKNVLHKLFINHLIHHY